MKKIVIPIIIVFMILFSILASEFIPQGNINLLGLYNITNATYFCNSTGSCFTLAELNTTIADTDTHLSADADSYLFNTSTILSFNDTLLNETIDARAVTNNSNGWNISFNTIFSFDWSNFTGVESQITDLAHLPTTNICFLNNSNVFTGANQFSNINSTDWGNVTILESQISDLQEYVVNNTAGWTLNFTNISISPFTNGSILFIGDNGTITENTGEFTALFWNDIGTRLGIGTNNPTEALSIDGNILFIGPQTLKTSTGFLGLNSPDGPVNIITGSGVADDLTVNTNSLVVEGDTENVGIGTATPSSKLDVRGNLTMHNNTICFDSACNAYQFFNGSTLIIKVN